MTNLVAGHYGGYAMYEIKNYVQHPITHREFGAYLGAVAALMMQQRIPLKEANDKGAAYILSYLANTLDRDEVRAQYIMARGWAALNKVDLFTLLDWSPEELQRYEAHQNK
jgi:hypothetical protein